MVLVVGALVVLTTDQGRALLVASHETGITWFLLHLGVWIWALSCWYWARQILTLIPIADRPAKCTNPVLAPREVRVQKTAEHLPRVYGFGAFVIVGLSLWFDGFHSWAALAWFVFQGAVFYLIIFFRRRVSNRTGIRALALPLHPERGHSVSDIQVLRARLRFRAGMGFSAVFCAIGIFAPEWIGSLGSIFVLFFILALWLPVLSFVSYRSEVLGIPIVSIFLVWAVVISGWNDNHEVRSISDSWLDNRPTLRMAHEDWLARNEDEPPLIMIATAGGGSRAAYWTATVLGALQDFDEQFHQKVFGISAVSGGAVGATVYSALLVHRQQGNELSCTREDGRAVTGFTGCAQSVVGRDLLSSAVVGMLFPDTLQSFWPMSGRFGLHDRARALERGWEAAWCEAVDECEDGGKLNQSFFELWPRNSKEWLPALFLNGTSVRTGERIVTSNLRVDDTVVPGFDFFRVWPRNIRASTAVNNSARFPYIQPAGTFGGEHDDQIVDGGYFDNSGATTAENVLDSLRDLLSGTGKPFQPVVIQIISDPSFKGLGYEVQNQYNEADITSPCARTIMFPEFQGSLPSQALSPAMAILAARSANGHLPVKSLLEWVDRQDQRNIEDVFFCFRLFGRSEEAILGWALPKKTKEWLACQLLRSDNKEEFMRLVSNVSSNADRRSVDDFLKDHYANLGISC